MRSIMSAQIGTFRKPGDDADTPGDQRADLIELKAVVARGDYNIPALEIAAKMLSTKVFHLKKHG